MDAQELETRIRALVSDSGVRENRALVRRLVLSSIELGQDDTDRLDLKIASAALAEMRTAFELFRPYSGVPKVTVFGSARTTSDEPLYAIARSIAKSLAELGWMVVTGAGPGIMQAAAEGAGPERALGVSIQLPFEEKSSVPSAYDSHRVEMKYFFTRKLMLVKESRAFVCLPGGFGTLDEMFELLTLQQTGKAEPVPIVLLDVPGGGFWAGLERFVVEQLIPAGVISADDFDRVLITDSVAAATAEVTHFWSNYDSLRWVGDVLVLRVRTVPNPAQLAQLNEQFASVLAEGSIQVSDALPQEREDNDRLSLGRVVLTLTPRAVGSLYQIIRALNDLSA